MMVNERVNEFITTKKICWILPVSLPGSNKKVNLSDEENIA